MAINYYTDEKIIDKFIFTFFDGFDNKGIKVGVITSTKIVLQHTIYPLFIIIIFV